MGSHGQFYSSGSDPNPGRVSHPSAYILDERRRVALQDMDDAKFCWFHFRVCVVASVGFFTDAYDLFAINIGSAMLGCVYGSNGQLSRSQDLGIKIAAPVGTFCGQLLFGWLADILGRKRMYGVELMIMILATFCQATSGNSDSVHIIDIIIFWRFIMGLGIGGDYPLSATISSEFSSIAIRGRLMTAVFAAQGWGNLAASIVSLIIVAAFKDSFTEHVDVMWRILIGLGCVPGVIALYFRMTIPESPRFRMDVERNVRAASDDIENVFRFSGHIMDDTVMDQGASAPNASRRDFMRYFSKWKNMKVLFGTSFSWFALDVAFYGLGLNSTFIIEAAGFVQYECADYASFRKLCIVNIILSVGGLIPGYWASFFLIDRWGRKPIQYMGFIMLTILLMIMGAGYDKLIKTPNQSAFIVLFCFANFFQNFGPNTTTFVIPGEAFPTRYRSTAYGISAASGKFGAIIAQVVVECLNLNKAGQRVRYILGIFSIFAFTGILSTYLLPETMGKSLEETSNENQKGDDSIGLGDMSPADARVRYRTVEREAPY